MESVNRPDEWKIEQGLSGAKLPVPDQTGRDQHAVPPQSWSPIVKDETAIKAVGDPIKLFAQEIDGWKGYVEWEKYPEKKAKAHKILISQTFSPSPEFQLGPISSRQIRFTFLTLDGLVVNPKFVTLDDLMDESRFPRMEKLVTMQCSETRRIEQITLYAGEGDEVLNAPWAEGAIGTARYMGISLKKVIKDCGGLVNGGKHLELYGCDTYFKHDEVMNYVVSVPWSKVKANEVMLAWEMNGEPLPKIHGYPLRVVVLGYIGARSIKWLYRIRAIENPTMAPVQSKEYLYFNQQVGKHNQRMTD
ncbi:hypothetical protein LTR66_015979, partial [Elasticomyces elasticus]